MLALLFLPVLPVLAAGVMPATLATESYACNTTNPCTSEFPCCSSYGYCGTGSYCVLGCDPLSSYSLDSCLPNPVCQNTTYNLANTTRILTNSTAYNGNASEYDWVLEQGTFLNTTSDGESALVLTLTEQAGTLLSSTRYLHYGQVTTRLKAGRWAGVVVASITMSSIGDEIDWEFPGNWTDQGQTNYFWQQLIPNKTNGVIEYGLTDTYDNWHDFTIDWQPDSLSFLVDGNVTRTILAADCVNNATGVTEFPNTPSRIQLSIWAAGTSSEPQGTVEWAGGMINWSDPDYVSSGHFYALYQSVTVQCNDPTPPGPGVTSYVYGANSSLDTPSISFSNASTILIVNSASSLSSLSSVHSVLVAGILALTLVAHLF